MVLQSLFWHLLIPILFILAIAVPVILTVAMFVYWERKVIGWMHVRLGPNMIGPMGLFQTFADVFKLLLKEIVVPIRSSKLIFFLAPLLGMVPAFAAWAVIPFNHGLVLANINAGILYLMAMSSLGIYGIILAGWSSNSRYALLGAMRAAAQMVSYELAIGMALICVLVLAGSLNLTDIIQAQTGASGLLDWFWLPLLPVFFIYWISAVAEANRLPFDVSEGESEIVAGFHVEYSGAAFALFYLTEYTNILLLSFLAAIVFLGGWLSPFPVSWGAIGAAGWWWLFVKAFVLSFSFLWFRATFPRYRYDQIMRLGWKVFIPILIFWIVVSGCMKYFGWAPIGA